MRVYIEIINSLYKIQSRCVHRDSFSFLCSKTELQCQDGSTTSSGRCCCCPCCCWCCPRCYCGCWSYSCCENQPQQSLLEGCGCLSIFETLLRELSSLSQTARASNFICHLPANVGSCCNCKSTWEQESTTWLDAQPLPHVRRVRWWDSGVGRQTGGRSDGWVEWRTECRFRRNVIISWKGR